MNVNIQTGQKEGCARIIEQPCKSIRFRTQLKGNNKTIIYGRHGRKSFPTICVENCVGSVSAVSVIVSCVSIDPPYRPHPHLLCNRKKSHVNGAYVLKVTKDEIHNICFKDLYIMPTLEKDVEQVLSDKRQIDPFNTGYDHKHNTDRIDLNTVRLCFQVYLEHADSSESPVSLDPVVSDPILIKTIGSGLTICWLSHDSASAAGGMKMCLLCEKVPNNDIEVKFYSKKGDWEATGTIVAPEIFKHAAIVFKTPEYRTQNCRPEDVKRPINVFIQLRRISQDDKSIPRAFQILPIDYDECNIEENSLKRKRSKHTLLCKNMTQEDSQTDVIFSQHTLSMKKTLNLNTKTIEPWELPPLSQYPDLQPIQATINLNTNVTVNNTNINMHNPCEYQVPLNRTSEPLLNIQTGSVELPEYSHYHQGMQPLVQIPSDNNNTDTLHNGSEKVYKQLKEPQSCNSTDTLNSDGWIKDLLYGIDPQNAENKIAPEPANGYITPKDDTLQNLDNMGNNINVMDMNLQQMDNFFHPNEISTNTVQPQDYAINSFNDIGNNPNDELNSSNSKSSIQEFIKSVTAMYNETY